jgi:hypothetical protein
MSFFGHKLIFRFSGIATLLATTVTWATLGLATENQAIQSQEHALRKQVGEYYTLLQAGRYSEAENCMTPDSRETFRKISKSPFLGFEIKSVTIDPGGKSALVLVQIHEFLPGLSAKAVDMPYKSNWKLTAGAWLLTLPKDLPTSPLSGIASRAATTPTSRAENLKFKGHKFLFGEMQQGEKKVARFPFTNESDHTVTIKSVETGTSLLTVEGYKKQYKPGEAGEIAIDFDPGNVDREYAQTVVVKTDPNGVITYLTVYAYIMPPPNEPPKTEGQPKEFNRTRRGNHPGTASQSN